MNFTCFNCTILVKHSKLGLAYLFVGLQFTNDNMQSPYFSRFRNLLEISINVLKFSYRQHRVFIARSKLWSTSQRHTVSEAKDTLFRNQYSWDYRHFLRSCSWKDVAIDSEIVCLWLVDHSFDRAIRLCAVYS